MSSDKLANANKDSVAMKQSHSRQSRIDACPTSLPGCKAEHSSSQSPSDSVIETAPADLALACHLSDSIVLTTPQNYEPRYAYPLILWLTDSHSNSDVILQALRCLSPQNYLGAMIGGCELSAGSIENGSASFVPFIQQLFDLEDRLVQVVRDLRDVLNVHTERIFIAGADRAATTAMLLALHQPDWFGGCISIGGRFPSAASLLPSATGTGRCRYWLSSGRPGESAFQSDNDQHTAALRLLQSGADVSLLATEPSSGQFTPAMLKALDQWLITGILQNSPA